MLSLTWLKNTARFSPLCFPTTPIRARSLDRILNPRSVAVIGASEDPAKLCGRVMNYIVRHGFNGKIVPVNPGAGEILGLPAYPQIGDAPGPIDVALLAVSAPQIPSLLADCGDAGVAGCVILSADFAAAGDAGAARQDELVTIARARDMRLIGPNCLGFINPALKLALTSLVALATEPMPAGRIGVVSQSGALMASLISHARDLGTGFGVAISVGNQVDLEICDFTEYFIENTSTPTIYAYIEWIKDGRRRLELAAKCRAAGKPLPVRNAGDGGPARCARNARRRPAMKNRTGTT